MPRMPRFKDRRRAQAGTTLIELLVSLTIVGFAIVLLVGTFSTALLDATLAKRNTAVQAVIQYELDEISGSAFSSSPQAYSECFATESSIPPLLLPNYQDPCPGGQYSLRADVTWTDGPTSSSQQWTISVDSWPNPSPIPSPVSVYKVNR
jgi:type II secretory pathway pseudopilin PulG